jgi:hypothetical protein
VYSDANFGGRCRTIIGAVADLHDSVAGNDAICSLRLHATCTS